MITRSTIESIQDAAHVEDVVGDFVQLKKRGANMIGLCPFHDEKTPSFVVSPAKGIYKCFGCGQSGDSIKFVMEHEHFNYPQALRYLAEKYSIAVEEEAVSEEVRQEADKRDSLYIVLKYAAEYFTQQLLETDEGKSVGLSYFKQRGYLEDTIRKFDLGYSPDGWDKLFQAATEQGYNPELLEQAGLIKRKEDKTFDFFRGRVMFPIHNISGKVVAFGGRILKTNEKGPKYINTPETDVYIKSKLVYGIYHAKAAIRRKDEALLVEGYTDVISLHQKSIEHVVASSGTSLTPDQVRLIRRFSNNITLLFDGDKAGIKAALRGVDILLESGVNVRVILLPDGEDPDSYLQKVGTDRFEQYLEEQRKDFVLFKLELLLETAGDDPIKRSDVIKDVAHSISIITDAIQRSVYIKACSRELGIEEQLLINEVNKHRRALIKTKSRKPYSRTDDADLSQATHVAGTGQEPIRKPATLDSPEHEIIRLLLEQGDQTIALEEEKEHKAAELIITKLDGLGLLDPICDQILQAFHQAISAQKDLNLTKTLMNHENEVVNAKCIEILMSKYHLSENWEKKEVVTKQKDSDVLESITKVTERYSTARYRKELEKLRSQLQEEKDPEKSDGLLKNIHAIEAKIRQIEAEAGMVIVK